MPLTTLKLRPEYRSFEHDIINEFYIPVLEKSVFYKRSVGYFSSTILIEITKGLKGLIENNGRIEIIASPKLTEEDIKAIKEGYEHREKIIENRIVKSINLDTKDFFEKKRLNLLSYLVAKGILDIKIAFIESDRNIGVFHEKVGIVKDKNNNKIVFAGSMNETRTAIMYNYESFDVYCSWKGEEERIDLKLDAFNRLWRNEVKQVKTIEFPRIAREKIENYQFEEPDFNIDEKELITKSSTVSEKIELPEFKKPEPQLPAHIELRDYQKEAIKNWEEKNYIGIFDMATGTGKTITGLAAATRLYEQNNKRLAIVIVCPYQHLVEQWVKDIQDFNMDVIIGYSESKQKDWRNKLTVNINSYNYGHSNHFCFITTNATFSTDRIHNRLRRIKGDLLLIVDEAHNFGASHYSRYLLKNANYRLALSATLERHHDEEGTKKLYNYFGEKCIEYTLQDAINNDMLTPYEYYPILVCLTEDELDEYKNLTAEIGKRINQNKKGRDKFSESAKHFLLKRARLIAGAESKLTALKKEMEKNVDGQNILIYCGATTVNDPEYKEKDPDQGEIRQIEAVSKMLGNELGMYVAQFTSKEDSNEREELIERFTNNDYLQALVAIRCLDEGVDIPSIQTAYILASSTNPKEYIQRRGRVLRLHKGKKRAYIYDFITLPAPIEDLTLMTDKELKTFRGLVKNEVMRMKDFSSIALNSSGVDHLISKLMDLFNIPFDMEDDELDEFI